MASFSTEPTLSRRWTREGSEIRTYHISGIAQFTIRARSADKAIKRAQKQAERIGQGRLIISLDNWACDETGVLGAELSDTDECGDYD